MAKEKKRKQVQSRIVSRSKRAEDEGRLYSTFDMMIEEEFPALRDLDFLIVLKDNWRADGQGNLKQAQAQLRKEEDRVVLPYRKGYGRDCLFLLNGETFGDGAEITKGELEFWVYHCLRSVDVARYSDGTTKLDTGGRVCYVRVPADLHIFADAFAKYGMGGIKSLRDLAVAANKRSAASIEAEQRVLWPEEPELVIAGEEEAA